VPELLQGEATAGNLHRAVAGLLRSPERCAALRARFLAIHRQLRQGANERAARAVLEIARVSGQPISL
jgi:lipid-A-disaccharide synthase